MHIDADAHVDECNETWDYLPSSRAALRPVEIDFDPNRMPGYFKKPQRGLFIDGQVFSRRTRNDSLTGTTAATRELHDVPARLRDLDTLGIGTQVLYPSTLLDEVTRRPEVEVALCESYNRWIADRCSDSNGRLRWAALLPARSLSDASREMRRAKEEGAVAIFKRAFECDDRRLGDDYFHPLYALAQELDLPICVHISAPYTGNTAPFTKTQRGLERSIYLQDAFLSLLMDGLWESFPSLRFGFIEAGAGWVPYFLWFATQEKQANLRRFGRSELQGSWSEILQQEGRLFITCEGKEDVASLVSQLGDRCLCVGTDYAHSDRASVLNAHDQFIGRDDLLPLAARNLTLDNAAQLYGFEDSLIR